MKVALLLASVAVSSAWLSLGAAPASAQQAGVPTADQLWNLRLIGAPAAEARGFTGRGFTIGIIDDIVQFDHPEFAGRWIAGTDIYRGAYVPRAPGPFFGLLDFHGTHVAGTAAGANVGVAPGASLVGVNIFYGAGNLDDLIGAGYRFGLDRGVRAFNNSWGWQISGRTETTADVSRALIETFHPGLLQAFREVAAADAVQVFSTGNTPDPQPGWMAGLPFFYPELQPTWLAVMSVGPNGQRASYSNACGVAADWCLAAPGGDGAVGSDAAVWSAWPDNQYYSINGTSMAAPAVTGALAVASEIFPGATGAQLTQLLLQTASDIGAPGVDAVYGWGLLNLGNVVAAADPTTAGTFVNASASRFSALHHVGSAIPLARFGAASPAVASRGGLAAYASLGADSDGAALSVNGSALRSIWAKALYGYADVAGSRGGPGAESTTAGFLIGADLLTGPNHRLGVAGGLSWTDLDGDAPGDSARSDGVHVLLYGDWKRDGFFAGGVGQLAFFDQSMVRSTIAGAGGTAATPIGRSTTAGTAAELSLRAGFAWAVHRYEIAPYLAAAARWQETDAFTETGAGIFSLSVARATQQQLEFGPGVRFTSPDLDLDGLSVRASLDVAYAHLSGDRAAQTDASLLGAAIRTRGAELGEHVFKAGVDLELTGESGRVSGVLSYDARFQDNAEAHAASAELRLAF